mgnify:CR=1 FL=1
MSMLTVVLVALIVIAAVWLVVAGVELLTCGGDWVGAILTATGVVGLLMLVLAACEVTPALRPLVREGMWKVAAPLLAVWIVSPFVGWWLSRTLTAPPVHLMDSQRVFLRKLSRRTWRYFEVFVTEGLFIDIGVPEDYARAQHELAPWA